MAHPIQIILTRQLAGYLSVPTFLVDPNGTLLFYNEPAEVLLGRRFDETGAMPAEEWSTIFCSCRPGRPAYTTRRTRADDCPPRAASCPRAGSSSRG